jgi:hypothetical protein
VSDLPVERLCGDRGFLLLFGGLLLGLELLVVLLADPSRDWAPMIAATMPRCFASSSSRPSRSALA